MKSIPGNLLETIGTLAIGWLCGLVILVFLIGCAPILRLLP